MNINVLCCENFNIHLYNDHVINHTATQIEKKYFSITFYRPMWHGREIHFCSLYFLNIFDFTIWKINIIVVELGHYFFSVPFS